MDKVAPFFWLTVYMPYDVILHKSCRLGVAMIAPALKFSVALIFLILINSLLHSLMR